MVKEDKKDNGFGMKNQDNDILCNFNDARHESLGQRGQLGLAFG